MRPDNITKHVKAMRAALDAPGTPVEAYNELVDAFYQFADAAGAQLTHPKLLRAVYALALTEMRAHCEQHPRDARAEYLTGLYAELEQAIERAAAGDAPAAGQAEGWPEYIPG